MRYFLVVGEPSGDIHASHLMAALCSVDRAAEFQYIGGAAMRSVAAGCIRDAHELAIMGFVEVFTHLGTIARNLRYCKDAILSWNPDVVILVDFAGFNLKIAKFCAKRGYKIAYYILPKVWAWGTWRTKKLQAVDWLYSILPFEVAFFEQHRLEVDYLGNPLLDELPNVSTKQDHATFCRENGLDSRPIIALLPGSRPQELSAILVRMCAMVELFPDYQFVVAGTSVLPLAMYQTLLHPFPSVHYVMDKTHELILQAEAAIVTSGTATLETALLGTPEVVVYRGNSFSIWLARRLAKVRWISLVNLILGREAVCELIQEAFTPAALQHALQAILQGGDKRRIQQESYVALRDVVGERGCAQRIAESLYVRLQSLKTSGECESTNKNQL